MPHRTMSQILSDFAIDYMTRRQAPLVENQIRFALLDTCGCILSNRNEEVTARFLHNLRSGASDAGSEPEMTHAMFSIGLLSRATDFDDMGYGMWGHPSAILASAMLPFGRLPDVVYGDVLHAYGAAYIVMTELGRMCAADHFRRGWHNTATLGSIGAAVAIGCLLRVSPGQLVNAIGIAASISGGLQGNAGSLMLALYPGFAANHGLQSVRLAIAGADARPDIVEGDRGFFRALGSECEVPDASELQAELARHVAGLRDGPAIKRFPSCAATHPAVTAAQAVRKRMAPVPIASVRSVRCEISPRARLALFGGMPSDVDEARGSLEYAVACTLADGGPQVERFRPVGLRHALAGDIGRIGNVTEVVTLQDPSAGMPGAGSVWNDEHAVVSVKFDSGDEFVEIGYHPVSSLDTREVRDFCRAKFFESTAHLPPDFSELVADDLLHAPRTKNACDWEWLPSLWRADT